MIAALQPVGGATGWGRVTVEDWNRQDELKRRTSQRQLEVNLFDLEPFASYLIHIDDVVLGNVRTNSAGDAQLKLESPDHSHGPVPTELAAAGVLRVAWVLDMSLAPVLEGNFENVAGGGGGGG